MLRFGKVRDFINLFTSSSSL